MVCIRCYTELDYACRCTWLDEISAQWSCADSDSSDLKFEFQFADPQLCQKSMLRQLIVNPTGEFQPFANASLAKHQPPQDANPSVPAALLNPYDEPESYARALPAASHQFDPPAAASNAYYLATPLHHPKPIRNLHANVCAIESVCESNPSSDSLVSTDSTCQDFCCKDQTDSSFDTSPSSPSGSQFSDRSLEEHEFILLHILKTNALPRTSRQRQQQQAPCRSATPPGTRDLRQILMSLQKKEAAEERKRVQRFFEARGVYAFLSSCGPDEALWAGLRGRWSNHRQEFHVYGIAS